eukprot:11225284-Karenia_brevis.AAC.1
MMHKDKMLKDVRQMLKVAESTRVGLQQVFHCAKAVVSHTRSFNRMRDDSTTWASKTICKAVHAFADFKVYRIGNMLIKQKDGTPIG